MSKVRNLLFILILSMNLTVMAGELKVDGTVVGDSSAIEFFTANYEARVIKIATNGTAHFTRIDETIDIPGGQQQRLIVDDVVVGSSDLITWFLINPSNGNVRLKTNGNLEIIVDQPDRDPQIIQFKADSSTITAGDTVTLTWQSTDSDYCEAGGDFTFQGQLVSNGSEAFEETNLGTRNYQITCFAESNGQLFEVSSGVSILVNEDPGTGTPGIDSFTASSTEIAQGEPITLSWTSNGVNFCEGKADFNLDSSTQTMPINSSKTFTENRFGIRTYTLWCHGDQIYTASINVNVVSGNGTGNQPSIRTFVASKTQPLVNETFTLSWDAINVDSCVASGAWVGVKQTSGAQQVTYTTTGARTFNLQCTENSTGSVVNRSVTVNVVNQTTGSGVQITSLIASPNPVQVGSNVTLTWSSANAVSCKGVSPGISNWIDILPANGSVAIAINESGGKTFVLRCFEKNNTSVFVDESVTISTTGSASPPVTTTLQVNTSNITEGQSVIFSWNSTNATSCSTVGTPIGWAGQTLGTSGSLSFTPRHDSMSLTYGVTCVNATSSHTANISVFSALPAQSLDGNNCAVPFATMDVDEWQNVWGGNWPDPNSNTSTITLPQGKNLAIHFNTGSVVGLAGTLTSAPSIGTTGVRTSTITECPGDYTYGEVGVPGQQSIDPDCEETWGVGTPLAFTVNDTYVANNGVCELKTNTDYYLNIRFSSACATSNCRGIYDYNRTQ